MAEQERIKQWLLETVRLMVDRPDDVTVEPIVVGDLVGLRIGVHPSEIGKVIGKQGRTAGSLRTIVTVIGRAQGARFALDIVEQPR